MRLPKPVQTRLLPPRLPKNNVERAQLLERIQDSEGTIALVVAGAGSGKSTGMRQVYDELLLKGLRVSWLNIDARDASPVSFLTYLFESLGQIGLMLRLDQHPYRNLDLSDADDLQVAFSFMRAELAKLRKPSALFFDDFHHISDPALIAEMNQFLDDKPPEMKVFIASRHSLDLQITRREMCGDLIRIGYADLKFSRIEAEKYLRKSLGSGADPKLVASVSKAAEGWVAALQLATVSINGRPLQPVDDLSIFAGKHVHDYLFSEIYRTVPDYVKNFLIYTSQLPRFNAELCEFAGQDQRAGEALEWLAEKNLFLIGLDAAGVWYRYHHLFSEFLGAQPEKDHKALESVRVRASEWCMGNDYPVEAVDLLLDMGEFDRAAALINTLSEYMSRKAGEKATILRWISRLPSEVRHMYPMLVFDYGLALASCRKGGAALQLSVHLERQIDSQRPFESIADSSSSENNARFYIKALRISGHSALDHAEMALALSDELMSSNSFLNAMAQGFLVGNASYNNAVMFDFETAIQQASEAHRCGIVGRSPYGMVWADLLKVMVLTKLGELDATDALLIRAEREVTKSMDQHHMLFLLLKLVRAEVLFLRGEFDAARDNLREGWAFVDTFGPPQFLINAVSTCAWMACMRGDCTAAETTLSQGKRIGIEDCLPRVRLALLAEEISMLASCGEINRMNRAAQEHQLTSRRWCEDVPGSGPSLDLMQRRAIAEHAMANGDFRKGYGILTELANDPQWSACSGDMVRIQVLLAYAATMVGNMSEARTMFDMAAKRAYPNRLAGPFLMYRRYVDQVMNARVAKSANANRVLQKGEGAEKRWVLSLFLAQPESASDASTEDDFGDCFIDVLTDRELQILECIDQGLTNAQLAAALGISVATAKWHLHNVFQKLDVSSRNAATAIARRYGLLRRYG